MHSTPDSPDTVSPAFERAHAAQARRRARPLRRRAPAAGACGTLPRQSPTQRCGADYETQALELLRQAGLRPLARNLRLRCGEIDLLMQDGETWVVVEVRARASARFGGAAASVTPAKQARLRRCAAALLPRLWRELQPHARVLPPCRFDVVAFEAGRPHWLRHAFALSDHSAL